MEPAATRSLYDLLADNQKNGLIAIKNGIESSGPEFNNTKIGNQVIEILESWLMDDEQKQNLASNVWDIFFLYAASSMLDLKSIDGSDLPAENAPAQNFSATSPATEPQKAGWPSLETDDRQQGEILELIGKGYLASNTMADEIPPRVKYDGQNFINIQFLAACLRLAMDFNMTAPDTLKHLHELLPPAASARKESDLTVYFTVVTVGAHPHVQATILVQVDCRDAEVHRALKRYESYLQRLLYNLNRIIRPRFLYTAVLFEINPRGYQPIDFKFGVDTSSALQLFAGNFGTAIAAGKFPAQHPPEGGDLFRFQRCG
jgi:hypothetical protein